MSKNNLIQQIFNRGTETVVVKQSLVKKLESGKRLRVKLGVDPTAPRIHLGHAVVLRKLRQFQRAGHQTIFLIGDFTARIGDPTDKLSARQPLTSAEIEKNVTLYKKQVGKLLDMDKVELRYNSEWHSVMDFTELFAVMSRFTVNQMMERDMFQKRLQKKKPLWTHEMMYPILQAYDSVALRAEVELGGTDQTFNMLQARILQPYYQQVPQDILTTPLIEGTDGKDKMSKSVGNTIDILDKPKEMFGKIMSLPDKLIIKYFELLTDLSDKTIDDMKKDLKKGNNPRNYKFQLAQAVVTIFHNKTAAIKAGQEFERVFKDKQRPSDLPIYYLKKTDSRVLINILVTAKLVDSKSAARRLVEQGAVRVNDKKVINWQAEVSVAKGAVVQVGKRRFVKIVIK